MKTKLLQEQIITHWSECFKKHFGIKYRLNEKYILLIFNAAKSFSKFGFYGSSLEKIAISSGLSKNLISKRMNKKELFKFILTITRDLFEQEVFTYAKSKAEENISKSCFNKKLEKNLSQYPDFFTMAFLGHLFNQEPSLISAIKKFHKQFNKAVGEMFFQDKAHNKEEMIRSSLVYLMGELSAIAHRGEYNKYISVICEQLKRYWHQEIDFLLPIINKGEIDFLHY